MSDVTRILNAIERGDAKATDELLPLVYEELRLLAAQKLSHEPPGQTLQRTVTHLGPRAGSWLVALMTCGFAAVLSASPSPSPVVSRLEKPARDTLASQIEAAHVKLLNVKIESEG